MRFGETTTMKIALGLWAACTLAITTVACTDDGMGNDDAASTAGTTAGTTAAESTGAETAADSTGGGGSDAQTPPMSGYTDIEAWLAEGHYLDWTCEAATHAASIAVSPHGMQLICSNDLMAAHTDGEYPVGASAVKELYMDDGTMYGHAVSLHFQAGAGGDSWYWYEKVFADHPAPHDANGVVADGVGSSGPAQTICVSCHSAAGSDAAHPGHDFVYVQVQ
jgi:hypothetical protein